METSTSTTDPMVGGGHSSPSLLTTAKQLRAQALSLLGRLDWLALLLGRFSVGLLFMSTGWGKVHDLAKVTEFFTSLNIPWPAFNATLVGYSELLCGAALLVGLLTRLSTIPLIVSMVVAISTARSDDVGGLVDLVGIEEFTYLVLLVVILILGPGRASLDRWLARRWLETKS